MVIYNRRRLYSIAVAVLLVCTGVHGQDNATTAPAPIITPAVTPAPPVTTEATTTVAPTPPPPTTTAAPPPTAAPTTTATPATTAPPPPMPEPSSSAPTNAPSASASPVVTPAPAQTQAPSSSSSSSTAAPSSTAASNTPAPSKSPEPTAAPSSQSSTDAPTTAASAAPATGSPVDAPLATSDSTDGSSSATPPSALGSSVNSPSSPSPASQQAAESKSGGGNGLTIALASTAVGVVALVMAVVLFRRRMQQMEDDDAKNVERIDDSMVFMQSTRPSSVPILQSQPRKTNNSRTVPTGRTLSVRDPLEPSYPAVPMVQTTHVTEVGGKSFRGSLPRISEAANSNSDASSNGSHIVDMRATEDLCRFTENTTQEHSFSGESYHEDDEAFDSRYLSDMTRETGGWSIDEGSEMGHGEVVTAANAVRSTEDLLQSARSMISIDDASARGSTEVWLDSSRFNAMVSTDVHIF